MALLAVVGALLLACAVLLRELQLARGRAEEAATIERLRAAIKETRGQLKRTAEDLHVLRGVLEEKRLLNDAELLQGRIRLIDKPRRMAAERKAIVKNHGVAAPQLVIDEDLDKVH